MMVSSLRCGALAAAACLTLQAGTFEWKAATPESQAMDGARLRVLQERQAALKTKALLVVRNDRVVLEWYAGGFGPERRHYTASLAKSLVGGMSLLLALDDGRLAPDDRAARFIPHWKDDPLRSKITIRHLATHSSGIEDAEENGIPHNKLPGWKGDFWRAGLTSDHTVRVPDPISVSLYKAPVLFEPGTRFAYSNPGMAVLAYTVAAAYQGSRWEDARALLRDRVMTPIGIRPEEWSIGYGRTWKLDGLAVVPNWGGGSFTARAVARIGRLLLRKGDWEGKRIISARAVEALLSEAGPAPRRPGHLGTPVLCWYSNRDGVWRDLPRDAFRGTGAGDQVLLVVPSLNLIVVRNGERLEPRGERGMPQDDSIFGPIVAAVKR